LIGSPSATAAAATGANASRAGSDGYLTSGEENVPNENHQISLPHHLLAWKDKRSNVRITAVIHLLSGTSADQITPKIEENGE
jgi:hypothetical protein